jgi:branched-chain amino acid transport system ATP-binding protein
MSLLDVKDVTVKYGGTVANDAVSLSVSPGRFVGLIGANGAGKTTLIDAISGFTPTVDGSISFDGNDLRQVSVDGRARMGMVRTFQSLELFDDLTVFDNMLVAREQLQWWRFFRDIVSPKPTSEVHAAVEDALSTVGVQHLSDQLPINLSHGQRKLVALARTLASGPKLILLDEPAAGLDAKESEDLGKVLRSLVDRGLAILLVDHDMALVLSVCDEVCVLDFGKVIAHGAPTDIRRNRRVLAAYLGSIEPENQGLEAKRS